MSVAKSITAPYSAVEAWIYDRVVAEAVAEMRDVLWGELTQGLPQDARILDVGCGGGQIAIAIARERPWAEVTGLDLSHDQVERARQRAREAKLDGRLRFVQGTALDLPFPDETFDVVFSIASIKHWPDQARGLAECTRVLAPGGKLVVVEADRGCRHEDAAAFVSRFRIPRVLRPLALAAFRTWVAGQSLDLEEARTLMGHLPFAEHRVERIAGTPGLLLLGHKEPPSE
ncbi:MAG: methyltransferase domain-containing protein [Myxococcota bacterium]